MYEIITGLNSLEPGLICFEWRFIIWQWDRERGGGGVECWQSDGGREWASEREREGEREREIVLPVSVHHTQSHLSVSLLSATLSSARAAHWDNILYLSFTHINQSFSLSLFSLPHYLTLFLHPPFCHLPSTPLCPPPLSLPFCCSHHLSGWRTHRTLEDR